MTTLSLSRAIFTIGLVAAAITLAGCVKPTPPLVKSGVPDVLVERPTVRPVTDYEDFTGRTEAYRAAEGYVPIGQTAGINPAARSVLSSRGVYPRGVDVTPGCP